MKGRTIAVVAVVCGVAALGGGIVISKRMKRPTVVPMPVPGLVSVALRNMTVFMSLDFKAGRGAGFSTMYTDSADFTATGIGTLHGRLAIANGFGSIAPDLGATGFVRDSKGVAVTGRIVRDSGTYELMDAKPGKTGPDRKGNYWTMWRLTDRGDWLIFADTLIGEGRTRADLPRPR